MPVIAMSPGNRLRSETSPYLLQHADNPVDWYPWGDEAFAAAKASGKPVLLSIGYSACHWCHVMAHESFEDPDTAAVMNELFINIKVDREERPDVDRIYQIAQTLLTRRGGGWPLTMFLGHQDQQPFFGGTYFPPESRHGMPGFRTLLSRVAEFYRDRPDEVHSQSDALMSALRDIDAPAHLTTEALHDAPLRRLRQQLEQRFDREYGGWTPAPKFPHAGIIRRLLRDWRATAATATPDLTALFMATLTLKRMADGGLVDHLGGGFYRYSVDARWEIPHFEKMLYDNGALLSAFAEAAQATGDPSFAQVTEHTAAFLLRDLCSPAGLFFSSWDADSEGSEGHYYLWTPAQTEAALGATAAALFNMRHGLDHAPNFEDRWHLVAAREVDDLAQLEPGDEPRQVSRRLETAQQALLQVRSLRVPPAVDDKILTSWNALAIRGLADAARVLGRAELAEAAALAMQGLRRTHWRDGRLLATSRAGRATLAAYLDDHALLIDATLALLCVRFDGAALRFAMALADALLDRFEDREHGGFFFTADDHESLIHRSRSFSDDTLPSGNAVAAVALQRLGWLLGETRYLIAAERTLRAAWTQLLDSPLSLVHMTQALDDFLHPHCFVILRGDAQQIDLWRRDLQRLWRPQVSVMAIPAVETGLPPALASKAPQGEAVAYLCRGGVCHAPYADLAGLRAALAVVEQSDAAS